MPIISARFANLLREIFADTYKGMMNARARARAREREREREREKRDRIDGRRNVKGKKL